MDKTLKFILIFLNGIMLILAITWYNSDGGDESLIVIIGQLVTLVVLFFEKNISNIKTKNIDNSKIDINYSSGDNIATKGIKDSSIKINKK